MDKDPDVNGKFTALPFNRATLVPRDSLSPIHTAQVLKSLAMGKMNIAPKRLRSRPRNPMIGGYLRYRTLPKWYLSALLTLTSQLCNTGSILESLHRFVSFLPRYRHLQTRRRSLSVQPRIGSPFMPIKMDFLRFHNNRRRLRHHRPPSRRRILHAYRALAHTRELPNQELPGIEPIPIPKAVNGTLGNEDSIYNTCGEKMLCVHNKLVR